MRGNTWDTSRPLNRPRKPQRGIKRITVELTGARSASVLDEMLGAAAPRKGTSVELTITNNEGLSRWINERMTMGRNITAIKGKAPEGSTYSDGDPITTPVNIAWQDTTTGEIYGIEYAAPNVEFSGTPAALSPEAPLERRVSRQNVTTE